MSYRAWVVATSIGAVEALKDQLGICRWNYTMRSVQQYAKNNVKSFYQAKRMKITEAEASASSVAAGSWPKRTPEETMRRVMDLNCWGPNTVRF